jgi:predicted RNA-binding protein with PIN domain
MRWLVDGYNVIRRDPELQSREAESLEAGRRALLHVIARARRAPQDEFTVVFDGARLTGGTPTPGRIRVVFSRPPLTADDEIMRLARQLRSGAVVVSSDRKIQDAARRAGSAVLTAEQFLEALDVPERSPAADSKDDSDAGPAREKRGNPRRLSKKARRAQRALGRLRQP